MLSPVRSCVKSTLIASLIPLAVKGVAAVKVPSPFPFPRRTSKVALLWRKMSRFPSPFMSMSDNGDRAGIHGRRRDDPGGEGLGERAVGLAQVDVDLVPGGGAQAVGVEHRDIGVAVAVEIADEHLVDDLLAGSWCRWRCGIRGGRIAVGVDEDGRDILARRRPAVGEPGVFDDHVANAVAVEVQRRRARGAGPGDDDRVAAQRGELRVGGRRDAEHQAGFERFESTLGRGASRGVRRGLALFLFPGQKRPRAIEMHNSLPVSAAAAAITRFATNRRPRPAVPRAHPEKSYPCGSSRCEGPRRRPRTNIFRRLAAARKGRVLDL